MSQSDGSEGRITTELREGTFLIGIDRPAKLNGFTPHMLRSMAQAYTSYEHDAEARCAVVYAEGKHFTAGLDLPKVAPHLGSDSLMVEENEIDPFDLRPPFRSKPIIFAVHGICFTLGIEMMLAADIVVAASDTRFSQLEVKRGLMPTGGATVRMVERAGWGNAMRYLLTGDEFDAATALRLGFVQEVVEPGQHLGRALELAQHVAQQAPLAVRATINNARIALYDGPATARAEFGKVQRGLLASEDFQEGLRSFKEKRPSRFSGR
ncbi:MAG: crotonase/enoyl-CoA hydratase family protein [Betaproteobacteria bacterium]|nr:MAG: crotonase/enoyl-CoA hydratase family protein [Betaproteobacteria bacterium]